jgi:hypothetical protein
MSAPLDLEALEAKLRRVSGMAAPRTAFFDYVNALRDVADADAPALIAEVRERDVEIARLRAQKDGAYAERDQCVALIARMALKLGYPAWLGRHEGADWDDDWRTIVFVQLPAGQVSWHIHDSELPMFRGLVASGPAWDGHSTEEKYRRVLAPLEEP